MGRVSSFIDGVHMTNGLGLFVGELRKLDKHLQFCGKRHRVRGAKRGKRDERGM
jgi:hypothetical protein